MDDAASKTLEEKLFVIDQEIRVLHQFCTAKGFSQSEIEKSAKPILEHLHNTKRKKWKWCLLTSVLAVAVAAAFVRWEPAVRFVTACSRITMIKMLPYWDWTKFYNDENCFLDNPYYQSDDHELDTSDCEICENIETIMRLVNVSQATITESYIRRDIPVIVTDGTRGWSASKLFTLPFIHQLYTQDGILRKVPSCMFSSNIRVKYAGARYFLSRVYENEQSNWYAHWEECDLSAVRVLRQFIKRPYFIPPMVETARLFWLLLSSNYTAKNYKPIDLGTSLMWLAQIRGNNRLRLVPRSPCNSTCTTLYTVLHEGEILLWSDFLWLLDYQPISSDAQVNIAIAAGGFYD